MNRVVPSTVVILLFLFMGSEISGQEIFRPGHEIIGGLLDLNTDFFVEGVENNTPSNDNSWPTNESPDHAIDGVGQKYFNFAESYTGFLVIVSEGQSIVDSMKLWTANDTEARDPDSYRLYGINSDPGQSPFDLSLFTLISMGPLNLPSSRNAGGNSPLDDNNSFVVDLTSNDAAFKNYLIFFPSVKEPGNTRGMQIGEVQLYGEFLPAIPTIGQWGLFILGLLLVIFGILVPKVKWFPTIQ